jgi:hypothetical protein
MDDGTNIFSPGLPSVQGLIDCVPIQKEPNTFINKVNASLFIIEAFTNYRCWTVSSNCLPGIASIIRTENFWPNDPARSLINELYLTFGNLSGVGEPMLLHATELAHSDKVKAIRMNVYCLLSLNIMLDLLMSQSKATSRFSKTPGSFVLLRICSCSRKPIEHLRAPHSPGS